MSSTPRWSEEEEEAIEQANQAQEKALRQKADRQRELEFLPARVQALEDLVKKLEQRLSKAERELYGHVGRC